MLVDAIIPARDEAGTVAANVVAARRCRAVREVIVVDDGSRDATAERAAAAGAKVLSLAGSPGSKAHALHAGVEASDAEALLFVDADCLGLTAAHLDDVVAPVVDGRAQLSIGAFDYGVLNPLILRAPPLSGERCLPRAVWDLVPPAHLDGYTIELRIDEVVAEHRMRTWIRTMRGVTHRTKRDKFGGWEGMRRSAAMVKDLVAVVRPWGDLSLRLYPAYLRNLTVAPPAVGEELG